MITQWYSFSEGYQYWVRLDENKGTLEFSCEPNSRFVGGGYFESLTTETFKNLDFIHKIENLFGDDALDEMIAAAKILEIYPYKQFIDDRVMKKVVDEKYYQELERLKEFRQTDNQRENSF